METTMKRSIALMLSTLALLSTGFIVLDETRAGLNPDAMGERRVNANLLEVQVDGQWHAVPMTPLSDEACSSKHPLYRRYCK